MVKSRHDYTIDFFFRGSFCPKLYGLPKIRKQGIPLRPIVECIKASASNIKKWLCSAFKPLLCSQNSYIRNSDIVFYWKRKKNVPIVSSLCLFDMERQCGLRRYVLECILKPVSKLNAPFTQLISGSKHIKHIWIGK